MPKFNNMRIEMTEVMELDKYNNIRPFFGLTAVYEEGDTNDEVRSALIKEVRKNFYKVALLQVNQYIARQRAVGEPFSKGEKLREHLVTMVKG